MGAGEEGGRAEAAAGPGSVGRAGVPGGRPPCVASRGPGSGGAACGPLPMPCYISELQLPGPLIGYCPRSGAGEFTGAT